MAKETTKEQGATAVAEPEAQPASTPQTPQEIAATEQALGIAPKSETAKQTQLPAKVPVRMGLAPATLEEGWRMAQFIAQSELVPKGYRGRPADVLVAIQYGMEVGLPPMAALHSIFVTNGRPSLWGDGFLAVIMASAAYKDHDEYYMVEGERREFLLAADLAKDDTTAVCTFWRTDNARPRTGSFSIGKAKKAGLWTKSGPWTEYPDRMLKYRARGFAGHDTFPDVLRGIKSAEEVIDLPPEPEAEPVREVRRLSEAKTEPATSFAENGKVVEAPKADEVTLEAHVKAVHAFLGGYTIQLADGKQVDTTEIADAAEIEKFIGTKHKVSLTCAKSSDGNLQLKSFGIAD